MAVASETDIANRALSKLGDARITDISQTNTKAARAMNHRFQFIRDQVLAAYPWRFAMKRTTLAALSSAPEWGYAYQYALPADCLRLVTLGDISVNVETLGVMYRVGSDYTGSDAPFEIVGENIQTDIAAPLKVEYVQQIADTGKFPDVFVEALASRLAYDACEELTQSNSKKNAAKEDEVMAIREARRVDALQRPPAPRLPGRWMMSRYG